MKQSIRSITARYVALPVDDVDTDQIIPARFLTTTQRTGLGANLFADWRRLPDNEANSGFVLDRPDAAGAQILVTGRNFGCGSSREHAVWALSGAGFRAVISSGFADIFRANALGNGLLPVQLDAGTVAGLIAAGAGELRIDLAEQLVTQDGRTIGTFPIDAFAKHCLMQGIDEMEYLLNLGAEIAVYEHALDVVPKELTLA
ncbi:MAG TPA: 3-isopropylmalate dehydratase small subunit [Gemmatimonadaceae bacterium]|nr:3-isopropylmalate dehydratase small subunit [Gemmatimonadaceae bacterium]